MKTIIKTFVLAFVIGVLNCGLATAQTPKVTSQWETSFNKEIGKNAVYQHFLGEDQNSFYVLLKKKSGSRFNRTTSYAISKCKKNNLQQEKTVDIKGNLEIEKVYFIKNETYLLALEGKDKERSVGFYKFNKSKMTLESILSYFSDVNLNNFDNLYFSPDSSKILLRTSPQINLNEKEKYLLTVYDVDFNKLWQKEIMTPFQRSEFSGNNNRPNFTIDNTGNVFLAGKIYKEALTKKSKEKEIAYEYAILKISQNAENKQLTLKEKALFYNKCFLGVDKNNQLFAVGFFSELSNLEKTGAYYLTVNNEFEVKNITLKDIPLKYLTYNKNNKFSKSLIKDIEKGIYTRYKEFILNTVLFDSNGDILLGVEEIMTYDVTVETKYGFTYRTDRLFYDTYLFKINADSEFAWLQRIPKLQWALDDNAVTNYMDWYQANRWSYQAFLSNGNVVVLYNDRPQNLKLTSDAIKNVKVSQVTKCPAVSIIYDKKGNATKSLAPGLSVGDLKLQTEFGKFERISNNRGFVTARSKSDSKMGFITIK